MSYSLTSVLYEKLVSSLRHSCFAQHNLNIDRTADCLTLLEFPTRWLLVLRRRLESQGTNIANTVSLQYHNTVALIRPSNGPSNSVISHVTMVTWWPGRGVGPSAAASSSSRTSVMRLVISSLFSLLPSPFSLLPSPFSLLPFLCTLLLFPFSLFPSPLLPPPSSSSQ
jgi:hypothetical protein